MLVGLFRRNWCSGGDTADPQWCQSDTIDVMAMTLRLDEQDHEALRQRAAADGVSMQDAARRAIREYLARSEHRARVAAASELILDVHADAIERLGR